MYKIAVYAICKNEEKFIERFVDSVKEADGIYILDTGSTDKSVDKFKHLGVHVESAKIDPWRFDVARNKSLEMVPNDIDICICIDIDEVMEVGWREKLENAWKSNTTRARYNYNWLLDDKGNPLVNFYSDKIHARHGYKWTHPVHEILTYIGDKNEEYIVIDNLTINHYPDREKSRSGYLPLLELSVKEFPEDDRNMHYLGREYMYYGRWNECIDTLIKHLNLKTATWKDERSASMRFIARSYVNLGRLDEARMWLDKAIEETPYLRDPYVERAMLEFNNENYDKVIYYCNKALEIKDHAKSYINEIFSWNNTIYDILSIAYYYTGDIENANKNIDIAISMDPSDERLKNNKIIYNS